MKSATALEPLFDEKAYLKTYPDVAREVEAGKIKSGLHHYIRHGQFEGRFISGFDPVFYLNSYPLAVADIAAGRAASAIDHFLKFGQGRGYIPRPDAPRPDNAAAALNRFGGFWVDHPNGLDLIQGKLEVGQITETDADRLRFWAANGYVILEKAVPEPILSAAIEDFDKAYSGQMPGLLFDCPPVTGGRKPGPYQNGMNDFPAKALDMHFLSGAIRDLIFSEPIVRFLSLLFDAPAYATQTLGFLLGSAQGGHQDSAPVAYSIPRQFCATWIALEDVTMGAGELFYYPGSHRIPDFVYSGRYKSPHEAQRLEGGDFASSLEHFEYLKKAVAENGLEREVFSAKRGDVLFWHADLVHGGNPVRRGVTRKSIVTHYCPKHVVPTYSEKRKIKIHQYRSHCYSTAIYKSD